MTAPAAVARGPSRGVALALSAIVFAMPVLFVLAIPHPLEQPFGVDFTLYRDVTIRWLGGGPYFEPYQLAGPYPISAGDVLYPPVALWLFVIQLVANALWTWLFFVLKAGALSMAEILVLWLFIAATIFKFWPVRRLAALLLLPYLAWVSFACALTWSLWRLNPEVLG